MIFSTEVLTLPPLRASNHPVMSLAGQLGQLETAATLGSRLSSSDSPAISALRAMRRPWDSLRSLTSVLKRFENCAGLLHGVPIVLEVLLGLRLKLLKERDAPIIIMNQNFVDIAFLPLELHSRCGLLGSESKHLHGIVSRKKKEKRDGDSP